jgi:hypothetical protein
MEPGCRQNQTHAFILRQVQMPGKEKGLQKPIHFILWTNEIEINLCEGA